MIPSGRSTLAATCSTLCSAASTEGPCTMYMLGTASRGGLTGVAGAASAAKATGSDSSAMEAGTIRRSIVFFPFEADPGADPRVRISRERVDTLGRTHLTDRGAVCDAVIITVVSNWRVARRQRRRLTQRAAEARDSSIMSAEASW